MPLSFFSIVHASRFVWILTYLYLRKQNLTAHVQNIEQVKEMKLNCASVVGPFLGPFMGVVIATYTSNFKYHTIRGDLGELADTSPRPNRCKYITGRTQLRYKHSLSWSLSSY